MCTTDGRPSGLLSVTLSFNVAPGVSLGAAVAATALFVLGRLLFSGDEITKPVRVLSGGEKNRLSFGRLMLGRHNVMLMDEPTNHLDMESIESLQYALEQYQGTLVFVSHDRQFVSGVATRVIEILPDGRLNDYPGTYEEYLSSQGIE